MATFLRTFWAAGTLAILISSTAFAAGPNLADAKRLLDSGKPKEAYALLAPHEFEMAGNREYDYLLGVAALDGGLPDKATLAFERVLAVDPNSAGARLDMARAYFALGSFERASQELQLVASQNPPPAARLVIERYQQAIEARQRDQQTTISGYIEGALGYDNNITSVVSDFTNAVLATYNLAGFQPTGSSVMRDSPVLATAAGIDVNHQLDKTWSIYAGADYRHRALTRAQNYSSDQIDLRGGLSFAQDKDVWRGGITVQQFKQTTDLPTADRRSIGLNGEWRRNFSDRDQGSIFGAYSRQRFPDIAVNDVNSLVVGGAWLKLLAGAGKPLLYGSIFAGHDSAVNRLVNGADNSRRMIGARLFAQRSTSETIDLFANTGFIRRDDLSANARSTVVRHGSDSIWDLTLGVNWRPAPNWAVRPQITYSTNRSNVALSEFSRTEGSVTVRYEFR